MKSQVLLTVWCNISGEAGGEIWHWSLLGVKGLNVKTSPRNSQYVVSILTYRLGQRIYPSRKERKTQCEIPSRRLPSLHGIVDERWPTEVTSNTSVTQAVVADPRLGALQERDWADVPEPAGGAAAGHQLARPDPRAGVAHARDRADARHSQEAHQHDRWAGERAPGEERGNSGPAEQAGRGGGGGEEERAPGDFQQEPGVRAGGGKGANQGQVRDQSPISPAPSPEILHHTVRRTWLFIAYSDESLIILPILTASLIRFSLKGWENVLIELEEGQPAIRSHFPCPWETGEGFVGKAGSYCSKKHLSSLSRTGRNSRAWSQVRLSWVFLSRVFEPSCHLPRECRFGFGTRLKIGHHFI